MFDGAKFFGPIAFGALGVLAALWIVAGPAVTCWAALGILFVVHQALKFGNRLEKRDRTDMVQRNAASHRPNRDRPRRRGGY